MSFATLRRNCTNKTLRFMSKKITPPILKIASGNLCERASKQIRAIHLQIFENVNPQLSIAFHEKKIFFFKSIITAMSNREP